MEALVTLKAELQRKRQQHQEALAAGLPRHKLHIKGSVSSNKGVAERDAKDREALEEERKTVEKTKSVLEKKAALYDKLQGGVAVLEDDSLNNTFLVNFQKKVVDSVLTEKKKRAENSSSNTTQNESPDDWVEHVDALGRTREVRRSELPSLLEQDRYLKDEEETTEKPADLETEEGVSRLQSQFEDAYRNKQRQRWEQQEELNAAKQDVHYQDVMFDEARTHGTSFVPLSGDADERKQQHQLLRDLHAASEAAARRHKREQRAKERGMAQRLAKIRQRKRLKRGLPAIGVTDDLKTPPQSDEDEDDSELSAPLVPSDDVPAKKPDAPVREWDVGKQVIGKLVEPADRNLDTFNSKNPLGGPVEMTQELWVDRQRQQRKSEFAPPSVYSSAGPSDGRKNDYGSAKRFCGRSTQLEEDCLRYREEDRMQQKFNRSGPSLQEDIVNECTDGHSTVGKKYETSSVFDEVVVPSIQKPHRKGAEIAPPANFDYYDPNSRKRSQSSDVMKNLEDAISKGLKKIKEQV